MDQNSLKPIASCSNSVDKGKHSGHVVTLTGQAAIRPCPACPSRSRPRDRRAHARAWPVAARTCQPAAEPLRWPNRAARCARGLGGAHRFGHTMIARQATRQHTPTPLRRVDAMHRVTPRTSATKPSPKPPPRSPSPSRRHRPPWSPLMPSDRARIHHLTTPLQLIQRTHRTRLSSLKPPMPSTSPTIQDPAPWIGAPNCELEVTGEDHLRREIP